DTLLSWTRQESAYAVAHSGDPRESAARNPMRHSGFGGGRNPDLSPAPAHRIAATAMQPTAS
ncbi:hypothetical protein, partial [Nocardia pseudovaccinii]|uniref:hypothetical protein n=1 Tax=Nocardia pseudovaccinii TaxID=189540 RepID=UPI001C3FE584